MFDLGVLLKNWRVRLFLVVVLCCALVLATRGVTQGIEFKGGVRIPISLEKPVDAATMDQVVEMVKLRINKYGMSQAIVRPLGDSQVIVEIPKAEADVVKSVQRILREQGRFEAIIDGRVALDGSGIMPGAIGGPQGERVFADGQGGFRWELAFAATKQGAEGFSKVALGKADYPVYMFLDRPEKAVVVLSRKQVGLSGNAILGAGNAEEAVRAALRKDGDDIPLFFAEDLESGVGEGELLALAKNGSVSKAIVVSNLTLSSPKAAAVLAKSGLNLSEFSYEDLSPVVSSQSRGLSQSGAFVTRWRAIGLLSGPILSASLADGTVNPFYQVTGSASGATPLEQEKSAKSEVKELKSVISGGRLPVSTVVGSSFTVAPTLGEKFLEYSWIGVIVAILAVSLVIMLRYGRPELVVPIVVVNASEILITMTIIGAIGTLDLSAMAGIISMMGTGVNDQIVLTDELLRKKGEGEDEFVRSEERELKERVKRGFQIVFTIAGVAVVAMLPLLLSGIVEIMGFALSVVLGVIVGISITRPAYAAIVENVISSRK
ncbi:MAG: hypothetical protein WC792_02410 [Candidatus Micrarchaeia archaeon]|jgi:preprotein translocase subunit SecD